jgi:type I restriction enzyme S subunit
VKLQRFIRDIVDGPFGSALTSDHYSDSGARVVRLGNIGAARFRDADAAYISMEYFHVLRRHRVVAGDLLIAGLGDENHPVGRACLAPNGIGPAIVKADCFRARLDEARLTHRYAAWALSSSAVTEETATLSRGSTRARINLEVVREIVLPVPKIEEQWRIVEFLDVETARLDALGALIERAIGLLEVRRTQHVLAIVEPGLGNARRPTIPLKFLSSSVSVGIVITPARWYVDQGGVLALRGLNVRPGAINVDDVVRISDEGHAVHAKSRLRTGDVAVVRTGQAGVAAVIPQSLAGINCIDLVIVRPKDDVVPKYLEIVLNSEFAQQYIDETSVGTIQSHLNVSALKRLPIPIMDTAEQAKMVELVQEINSRAESMQHLMKRQMHLLAERRQALVTAAVTGQFDVTTGRGADLS